MRKIRIGFLGYGTRALDYLMENPLFEVRYFLTPKANLCRDVYDARARYQDMLEMEVIQGNEQISKRFAEIDDVECFLMNACSIILSREALSKMKVFNIHPGDISYNRGHQPHCWTVLLGENKTKIVLHRVHEQIDSGEIVKAVEVDVSSDDSATDVLNHAEERIPILLDALYRHLTQNTPYEAVVTNGAYRRIMVHNDYEIHFKTDTKEQMKRKILARSMHHGAFFAHCGNRVYVDKILFYQETAEAQKSEAAILMEKEDGVVYVTSDWRTMALNINKIEPFNGIWKG